MTGLEQGMYAAGRVARAGNIIAATRTTWVDDGGDEFLEIEAGDTLLVRSVDRDCCGDTLLTVTQDGEKEYMCYPMDWRVVE